jgi:Cu/Ag efflux protein CusF
MRMNLLTTTDFFNFFEEFFMKLSKYLFAFLLVFSAASFTTAYAQDKHHSHADAVSDVSASHMAEGEIKKINRDSKKMTIKHGDIKSLDMPGMTMVFQIRDNSLLETFKAGDKVKFVIEKLDGAFVVTSMQLAN